MISGSVPLVPNWNLYGLLLKMYLETHPFFFLFKHFIYSFLERRERRDKERERNISVWLSLVPPTGDLACHPGMCPDWGSNQWPCGSQAGAQSTEPHQPGLKLDILIFKSIQTRRRVIGRVLIFTDSYLPAVGWTLGIQREKSSLWSSKSGWERNHVMKFSDLRSVVGPKRPHL